MPRLERTTPARVSERQALEVEARLKRLVVDDEMGDVRDVLPGVRLSSKVKVVRLVPTRARECVRARLASIRPVCFLSTGQHAAGGRKSGKGAAEVLRNPHSLWECLEERSQGVRICLGLSQWQ